MTAPSIGGGAKFGPKPTISLIQRIRKADKGNMLRSRLKMTLGTSLAQRVKFYASGIVYDTPKHDF